MARVKLAYPKIPNSRNCPLERCIAFEKYDGTNLHWVWEFELGWYGFGTRRDRFDLDDRGIAEFNAAHSGLEEAPGIFLRDFATALDAIFRGSPLYSQTEIVVFTEFFGESSFAGMHRPHEPKQLVLFDVQIGENLLLPQQFIQEFGTLPIARVVYQGKLTGQFVDDVRAGKYGVQEGVVCKGGKTVNDLWMVKIKTDAYLQKLKQAFKDDWQHYWE